MENCTGCKSNTTSRDRKRSLPSQDGYEGKKELKVVKIKEKIQENKKIIGE